MQRWAAWSMLIIMLSLVTPAWAAAAPEGGFGQQRYIVVFDRQVDTDTVTKWGGQIQHSYHHIPACSITIPIEAVPGLRRNPRIISIEPDQEVTILDQTPDWGLGVLDAPAAWESGLSGAGVKVAVVDTGIAPHEDLTIAGGMSFTSYTTSYADDNGHGTHVAGIIGAADNQVGGVGIAPQASLYAVKVIDGSGAGTLSDLISGIDWCITNDMDIVNMSIGTPDDSPALEQIVDQAYSQGLLLVAAAGNDGTLAGDSDTVKYPANYDSVIAVGAIDAGNNRASWSACGSQVEVVAPGEGITSTFLNNSYATLSGTSLSTPYVSGDLALLKQAHPDLSNLQLRAALDENVVDLGEAGRDTWYGYGLIQAPVYLTYGDFVTRFFQLCLQREPAPTELAYWEDQLTSGQKTGADLARGFFFSAEFVARAVGDDEYIDILYHALLDRAPDLAGQAYWQGKLEQGQSRLFVLAGLVRSAEFGELCANYGLNPGTIEVSGASDPHPLVTAFVTRFYQLCLERDPDQAGRAFWVDQLVSGQKTGADAAQGFVLSTEFQSRNLSDGEFINILYAAFLGRDPDPAGLAYWQARIAAGVPRLELVAGFVRSMEFSALCDLYGIKAGVVIIY
jgi:minor extracellular protease Epr